MLAAGTSERMGGIDKLMVSIAGLPLVAWTLRAVAAAMIRCPVESELRAPSRRGKTTPASDAGPIAVGVLGRLMDSMPRETERPRVAVGRGSRYPLLCPVATQR